MIPDSAKDMATPMQTGRTVHLTDEQLTDVLLGVIPAHVTAHLNDCACCAQEATRVASAISSFERHSRVWAERRSAAYRITIPASQPFFGWPPRPQAWAAAAAAMVLAASLGLLHRAEAPPAPQTIGRTAPAQTASAPVSPATLKADNELLSAIDGELQANSTTPASVYGLEVASPEPEEREAN